MTSPGVWLYRGWKPACVVLAGGDLGCAAVLREEIEMGESFVACADSGADYLDELSLKARLWMGDGDSVRRMPPEAESHRYPVEKDETDLELVLAEIARRRLVPVALLGALGGRLDHELANLHLAGAFRRNHGPIALYGPACRVRFVLPG
ncbi:MAG: thiamine diphosphokinase, partial [Candidatus Wallbacteria bacterium]|nr:thiamine diphosphokinase [Candidatus Wallbacteria bacterium]